MTILRTIASFLAGIGLLGAGEVESGPLWSFEPVGDPVPPAGVEGWGRNAIDAYLAEGFREKGLAAAPQAERRALIRRATYDLTGLPPEADQVEAFVADPRPAAEAFREIVDTLLASNHYGEQWGRHWLDVVRYADTAGENSDHPLPHAWRYRNWVIDAFNHDKPYDAFVREQLAGDILAKDKPEDEASSSVVATGYLALARRFGHDIDKSMYLTYEDAIDNLGKTFLGLSIACARCHDHKHDPIPARDYYALYGVLESTRFAFPGCEPKQQPRDLVPLAYGDALEKRRAWEKRRDELAAAGPPASSAEQEAAKSTALNEAAAKSSRVISQGDLPDGGSVLVSADPIEISVRKGEAVQLSILPRQNYGADTTILDFAITHNGDTGEQRWSLQDLIDRLPEGNPITQEGATWCFLDTKENPKFLSERNESIEGKPELKSWTIGGTPSVFVNTSADPVKVWCTLPARTFFVHPGEKGPVAIAWLSPVEGRIRVDLKVSDGHPGGDGVAWRLEHFADPEMAAAFDGLGEFRKARSEYEAILRAHALAEPVVPVAFAVAEGAPKDALLQKRGNPEDPGEVVPRTFLTALGGGALGGESSSGRLDLANRIASPDNPLTARVMVNRIWAWHFGRGIVATPNDFGTFSSPPVWPGLLDYLARYFMDHDWSVKAMHRLIMESAAYQQAARDGAATGMLAGFARRRLTVEELRDSLLAASGELDTTPGEAHPFPAENTWSFTQHGPFAAEYPTSKRTVYVMRKRNRTDRFFALFNGADPNASTPVRDVTTVPTQALYFMNDPFFHERAEKFAARIRSRATNAASRLDFACREIFSRPATQEEIAAFEEFAGALAPALEGSPDDNDAQVWNAYARVLLGGNEFLYLD